MTTPRIGVNEVYKVRRLQRLCSLDGIAGVGDERGRVRGWRARDHDAGAAIVEGGAGSKWRRQDVATRLLFFDAGACVRLSAPPDGGLAALSCERPFARPVGARMQDVVARNWSPGVIRPSSRPPLVPHASTLVSPRETAVVSWHASTASLRGSRMPRFSSSADWPMPAEPAASHQSDAPSTSRSRSPASSIARRAFLHGRGGSPRARTRLPASSAISLAACLSARVQSWPSLALHSSMSS